MFMLPLIGLSGGGVQQISWTVFTSRNDYNAAAWRADAIAAGWNGVAKVDLVCTIDFGVVIGSTSTGAGAFSTGAEGLPEGSTFKIINQGTLQGRGGDGGKGGNATAPSAVQAGSPGGAGGPAVRALFPIILDNYGAIRSGGGGGGGGGASIRVSVTSGGQDGDGITTYYPLGGGGGGGGRGRSNSSGGAIGYGAAENGRVGTAGTEAAPGIGGAGGSNILVAGAGSDGGQWATPGAAGSKGNANLNGNGGAGGAAGPAIKGIGNVTLTNLGTITGAQVA